jgi:hypothetical protein
MKQHLGHALEGNIAAAASISSQQTLALSVTIEHSAGSTGGKQNSFFMTNLLETKLTIYTSQLIRQEV